MDFPRLKDTKFPDLTTVDVYQFQNTFDYTRWSEDSKIKLVNVVWNSDYANVVAFDTNANRDKWFDSIDDYYTIELAQAARIVPDNYIKLPIPYDVMARFNYLYIDIPIATDINNPIDYETNSGMRRWYFFIDRISYLSPNSTQVFLQLDVWTNYQNDVEINYLMLERGHAPVRFSDTNEYLANPIGNNKYLLAPDVNFDNAGITRSGNYVPFGNGEKYVCIASSCGVDNLGSLGTVTTNPDYDPTGEITYEDSLERWGYQLIVHGFGVGNGLDFSNVKTPATPGVSNNGLIPNNLTVYAIPADECYGNGTFFNDVVKKCPQFLNTVCACFVVDGSCLDFGTTHTIAGHTVRTCVGNARNLLTKQLKKSDFSYPKEFERFAKLYTSPYAKLEITDNDGTTYEVNIEETSTLKVESVVSVAFPYINYRVYIDGIGGVGSNRYSWVDLKGVSDSLEISDSDWFKYCFDWKIPTFALYMDGETAYQLAAFNRNIYMGRKNALVAYHNTMRSANTAMENAIAGALTGEGNSVNSANCAETNAKRSAAAAKLNADDNATLAKTNTDAVADTTRTNVDNNCNTISANVNLAIAATAANEEAGIDASFVLMNLENDLSKELLETTNNVIELTTDVQNDTAIATTANTTTASIDSAGLGGISGGAALGAGIGSAVPGVGTVAGAGVGAVAGYIIGSAGGYLSAEASRNNTILATQASETCAVATIHANEINNNDTILKNVSSQNTNGTLRRAIYTNNNNQVRAQTDNSIRNDKTNADNVKNTTIANTTRAKTTANKNAKRTYVATYDNATDTHTVALDNAEATKTLVKSNAKYTREIEEFNAKELLENAADNAMARFLDARNDTPRAIGESTGNASADYMRTRGIQIKVKTQSNSAIRQTGDIFARFGYSLNQVWNVNETGLTLMKNFTYWKASDIWVNDRQSSNNAVNTFFEKIFLNGVTVWNDPEKVGRVSIYDN